MHSEETDRRRNVVEVESVAFIVCHALELDTSDYSFAYVAHWSDCETELVKDTTERVVACAKQILEGLGSASESETAVERAS